MAMMGACIYPFGYSMVSDTWALDIGMNRCLHISRMSFDRAKFR